MRLKDWLAALAFTLVVAFAVTTVVIVIHHSRTHRSTISQKAEENLQKLCSQNPGNGGC